jgi:hypothetical protein
LYMGHGTCTQTLSPTRTDTDTGRPMIKCKGVMLPPRNELRFVVASNDFVLFKIALIVKEQIQLKISNGLEVASYFYQ